MSTEPGPEIPSNPPVPATPSTAPATAPPDAPVGTTPDPADALRAEYADIAALATQAARLGDALKELDAVDPKDAYTKTLVGLASRVLASIETDANPDPAQIAIWVENNKPVDTPSLFKGAEDAVVQPASSKESTE